MSPPDMRTRTNGCYDIRTVLSPAKFLSIVSLALLTRR